MFFIASLLKKSHSLLVFPQLWSAAHQLTSPLMLSVQHFYRLAEYTATAPCLRTCILTVCMLGLCPGQYNRETGKRGFRKGRKGPWCRNHDIMRWLCQTQAEPECPSPSLDVIVFGHARLFPGVSRCVVAMLRIFWMWNSTPVHSDQVLMNVLPGSFFLLPTYFHDVLSSTLLWLQIVLLMSH